MVEARWSNEHGWWQGLFIKALHSGEGRARSSVSECRKGPEGDFRNSLLVTVQQEIASSAANKNGQEGRRLRKWREKENKR